MSPTLRRRGRRVGLVMGFFRRRPQQEFLAGALQAFQKEFEALVSILKKPDGSEPVWAAPVRDLVQGIEVAARDPDSVTKGWQLLHAARRIVFSGYDDSHRDAAAKALVEESRATLSDSRHEAVKKLVETTPVSATRLAHAQRLRDDTNDASYHNTDVIKRQMTTVFRISLGLLFALVAMAWAGWLNPSATLDFGEWDQLLAIIIVGGLGGSLSGLLSLFQASRRGEIADVVLSTRATALRAVVGAVAALGVLFLFSANLFENEPRTLGGMLAFSFSAGITERWVISSATSLGGRVTLRR